MQIKFTTHTMCEQFDELGKKMKEVRQARLIHTIFPCIFSLILIPTLSSFIFSSFLRILFSIFSSFFLCILLPYIFRRIIPSCQFDIVHAAKFFYIYALQYTQIPEIVLENRRGKCIVCISFENKMGERVEEKFKMEGRKREGIGEEIIDFDEDVVWVPKK